MNGLARLLADESGTTAIEYALVALLIGVAIAATVATIAPPLQNAFNTVAGAL
ncbi:MAG TPA: Flp family type IVb pilin [Stellaceae bacterium]|nr:Flp family type IVb pilin [Stellaceae bacterium]